MFIYGQTFVVRMGCLTPCRTFPQMTSRTLPARQPSSMIQSSLSGENLEGLDIICLFFSHWFLMGFPLFQWRKKEVEVGVMLGRLCGVAYHDSRYHTEWTSWPHGIWRWASTSWSDAYFCLSLDIFYKIHLNKKKNILFRTQTLTIRQHPSCLIAVCAFHLLTYLPGFGGRFQEGRVVKWCDIMPQ